MFVYAKADRSGRVPQTIGPAHAAADKIRELRGHDETTVFQRCTGYVGRPSASDYARLMTLCENLLEIARSSGDPFIRHYASDQILSLAEEDSLIRAIVAVRYPIQYKADGEPSNPFKLQTMAFRIQMTISNPSIDIRSLWCSLLVRGSDSLSGQTDISGYIRTHYALLKSSLSDPDLSFLAARYLRHVLSVPVVGNGLFCVAVIWHHYMVVAATNRDAIEWPNFDECLKIIYDSNKPFIAFVSPLRLARLKNALFGGETMAHLSVFRIMFGFPRLSFKIDDDGEYTYTYIGHNLETVASFASDFAYTDVLLPVRNIYTSEDKVFDSRKWMEYCRIVNNVSKTYSIGSPATKLSIARCNTDEDPLSNRSDETAVFLLARFIGIDRYCKRAESERHGGLVPISSMLVNNVRKLARPHKGTTLPQFDNVPYLRRFRVNGRIYITSDYLPEPPNTLIASSVGNMLHDLSVDTMVIDGSMVLWLRFDSVCLFEATGHYPILAGHSDEHGGETALYVAAVKNEFGYHFTCVEDGAGTVKYTDENGVASESGVFLVLALRHDPAYDFSPPYPRIHRGAMDQTGPLYWLKFWPWKAHGYHAASDSAKSDDRHLKSVLNSYYMCEDGDGCRLRL